MIVYELLCNLLSGLQGIQFWLVEEIHSCILYVDNDDGEKKTKHMVSPWRLDASGMSCDCQSYHGICSYYAQSLDIETLPLF